MCRILMLVVCVCFVGASCRVPVAPPEEPFETPPPGPPGSDGNEESDDSDVDPDPGDGDHNDENGDDAGPNDDPTAPPANDMSFWGVVDRHCTWCHTSEHPAAGIDLTTRALTPAQWDEFGTGVQLEMAPFVEKLGAQEKSILLDGVRAHGGRVPPANVPTRYTWNLNDVIAAVPNGAPAPGFAFIIEDAFIDTQAWTVQTYTDRHGRSYKGIALDQTRQIDQSVFSSSRNPSSYLVFAGVPWHGRFYDGRLEGDVRVGRWMSVGLHAERMSPTGRSHRRYVRLQFDRDSICLRSAPTSLETWPWGDEADAVLDGDLCAAGFYQTSSEWLHFVLQARTRADGVLWSARVTNPATGQVVADLAAVEHDPSPLRGTFFLHAYSTGDKRHWANLEFSTSVDAND